MGEEEISAKGEIGRGGKLPLGPFQRLSAVSGGLGKRRGKRGRLAADVRTTYQEIRNTEYNQARGSGQNKSLYIYFNQTSSFDIEQLTFKYKK